MELSTISSSPPFYLLPTARLPSHTSPPLHRHSPSPFPPSLKLALPATIPLLPIAHRSHPPSLMASSTPAAVGIDTQPSKSAEQAHPPLVAGKDLLIVGPGVLGRLIAQGWMKEHPGCTVVGQTKTTTHHEELQSLGLRPVVNDGQVGDRFPYVVFSAPPSGSEDYAAELRSAAQRWNGEGVFLFTSSSAVYDCYDNGLCDENTAIVPLGKSPRIDIILKAEEEVLKVGGTIVRLAGLYTLDRGPHAYWAKKRTVDARPDHILNLIHYEDAACLCITVLKKGFRGHVFMGCDNHPLSRQELMDIVNRSGKFEKFEGFTGFDGPLGKKMNNKKTRNMTGWQPKFSSFLETMGVY